MGEWASTWRFCAKSPLGSRWSMSELITDWMELPLVRFVPA
jgi:hypothetical protein